MAHFGQAFGYEFSSEAAKADQDYRYSYQQGDRLLQFDHFRRQRLLDPYTAWKAWAEPLKWFEVERFCEGYKRWKEAEGLLDYTDLLEQGQGVLPCDVVIVDESQDLSPLQWQAFWNFAGNAKRVYIAGDDDQAIYTWAGASPEVFLNQPGEREILPQSYRCPRRVSALAQEIIRPVRVRQPKTWHSRDALGDVVYAGRFDQVGLPAEGSVLVLYRNHMFASDVSDTLKAQGERFDQNGRPSIGDGVALAIVEWEQVRKNQLAVIPDQVERLLELMTRERVSLEEREAWRQSEHTRALVPGNRDDLIRRGLPPAVFHLPWFEALDRLRPDLPYLKACVRAAPKREVFLAPARIRLSSIHGAKGTQADHVLLLTEISKKVERATYQAPDDERRVFYVGVTRARESLTVLGYGHPFFANPTRGRYL
jgi:DNA helicase-2/ATP-dependent DNA helicase PcrA